MPEKRTVQNARKAKRQGKAPSTQAGEFVHEEIRHVRQGKHGARSSKQAIAIGLSKARRAGVDLPPPKRGTTSERTRKTAERSYKAAQGGKSTSSSRRSTSRRNTLKREGRSAASKKALSKQARAAARRRPRAARSAAARKSARTRARRR